MKISNGLEWMPQTGKEENTIQFNYFRDNELVNIKYRDGAKNFKMVKDAEKIFYNLDNIRTEKEVIICEGEMDALSFIECGYWNTTSIPNGSTTGNVNLEYLDNCYEYFENKEKIYLCLDNDEAGQNVQNELIRRLGAERCYLIDLSDFKDINEVLTGEGKEKVIERVKEAKIVPLEGVQCLEDIKPELHDFYLNGMPRGFKIGKPNFDEIFTTNTSQYIVVTGIPTSGKSDFVDQMCVGYNLNYNWKIAYASPENKPTVLHVDKIARKYYGERPTSKKHLNYDGWKIVEDRINNDFTFLEFDKYDLTSVLKKGAELVRRKGIKCLVIDPYNKIRLKESMHKNINDYTNDYLTKIDEFCREFDVLVILVAHPVKIRKDSGEKKIPEPTFYDIKGGGEFYDMSYHGLLVHRNYDNGTVKIKVLKCKFQHLGTNQAETHFCWSPSSGRYCSFDGNPDSEHELLNVHWENDNILSRMINNPEQKVIEQEVYSEPKFETNECPF
jgi:twinkle protein